MTYDEHMKMSNDDLMICPVADFMEWLNANLASYNGMLSDEAMTIIEQRMSSDRAALADLE